MSVKVIAQLHPMKSDKIIISVSPKSIEKILTELNSGFPLPQARVCKNGEIVKDFSVTANDGDTLSIKFVPYGGNPGAGMKIGGWALAGLGVVLGVTLGWTGIGGFAGAALIGTGLSMALGGTVLMNIKIPSVKNPEKPENDPSIRGGKNQARPHGRIPVLFGRHRVYPDIAANPYTSIIDGKQYYTQLFCGGYKDCVIDRSSFKLGETLLTDFSHTKNINSIIAGSDPVIRLEILQNGEASNLYPYCVNEDIINAPLSHEIDGADGHKIPGDVIRTTPDKTNGINVDIFFHNGLGRYNDNGELQPASVTVRAWYKPASSPDSAYLLLGSFDITESELKTKRFQITKNNLAPGKYTVKIERVTPDSSDGKIIDQVHIGSVRSFKYSRPVRAEKQKDLTIIVLRVLATGKLNGVLDSFNYTAAAKLPVYSDGGSGGLYWLQSQETQNPASALLYALRGRAAQQKVSDDDIDWHSLEAFYTWCAEHEYSCNAYLSQSVTMGELIQMIGSTSRADILRIDSKISVVQDIERFAPMQLFTPKNTVDYKLTMIKADIPDALSLRFIDADAGYAQNEVNLFNTHNRQREKEPDTDQKIDLWGVTNYKQAQRIGMYNYACMKNRPFIHTIEVDIEYLLCNKGDRVQYAGDIALAGTAQGRIKGLIYIDGVCVGIDTDEPIEMESGKTYAVRIRTSKGEIIIKDVIYSPGIRREHDLTYYPVDNDVDDERDPEPGDMYAVDDDNVYYEPQNIILFAELLGENEIIRAGDIYAFGVRGYEVIDLIITDLQPGRDLSATLTCVEYAPEIFGVDEPDFILPPFENKITPVSGAADSGIINPSGWQRFTVYNDNEERPPRPAGDGTNDGWHNSQTQHSLWASEKISDFIENGTWGTPVRIRAARGTDDIQPVWLTLSVQHKILDCDPDGNIFTELLPFTSQAQLFRWNSAVNQDVEYSLAQAVSGVTISSNGLVTVGNNVVLHDGENNITVRAVFENVTYERTLTLVKSGATGAPRYLGTVNNLTINNAVVSIATGPQTGQVRARQGDFVLALAAIDDGTLRSAGSVFQWSGTAWQFRSAAAHADLYIRCFKDGLNVLANNTEWFGAVIARELIAMKAFIEELSAQTITLKNGGIIQSENFQQGQSGFRIKHDGDAEFNNIKTKGMEAVDIKAVGGTFVNIAAINLTTNGTLNNVPITGYAKNHPANNTTSTADSDYPIGTLIIAGTSERIPLNGLVSIWKSVGQTIDHYAINNNGAGRVRLPGMWRTAGYVSLSASSISHYHLCRRVS